MKIKKTLIMDIKFLIKQMLLPALAVIMMSSLYAQNNSFTITFDTKDIRLEPFDDYSFIDSDISGMYYKEGPGAPALPLMPVNFAVPYGSKFVDLSVSYDTILIAEDVSIMPMQSVIPFGAKPVKQEKVAPLKRIYKSSNPYPENIVNFTSRQLMSCYQFFTFDVSPFMYIPLQKKLYLVNTITVQITYTDDPELTNTIRHDDGTFYGMLSKEVINPDDIKKPARNNDHIGKCRYLIITSDSLKESFEPLANWKVQKGITTEIVTVEDIYENYFGESPQVKVKSCILDYYLNKGTVFVLLGGDIEIVPVQRCYAFFDDISTSDNTIPTDLFYACMDGTFNWDFNNNKICGEISDNIDIAPEVMLTRATVQTKFHTETFVNKTLNYEKNPPLTGFANEMLNFGIEIWESWDGRCDGAWLSERMFEDYVDPYWNGTHHSFYTKDSTSISYDINDSLISSELNKGYNFTYMASHGQPNGWGKSRIFFNMEDAYNLNNAQQQGIVVTGACYTNAFANFLTHDVFSYNIIRFDSCFSESFLRNPSGGALAYHGSSRVGLGMVEPIADLGPSFLYSANFFKSIFDFPPNTMVPTLGYASTQTKIHLIGPSMQENSYRWLQFTINTLGDPTLNIYTDDPEIINLTCPDSIPLGNDQEIAIHTGTPDINICISNGQDVYHAGKTNNSGVYYCSPSPVSMDPLIVTVTGYNKVYNVDTIKVGVPEGAVIIMDEYYVKGKNDHSTLYCENTSIGMIFKNIGVDTSFNTKAEFSCPDEYISINNNILQLGDIPPGDSIVFDTALNYDISCYIPDKHRYYPEIEISNSSSLWTSILELLAFAPNIHIENIFTETGGFHYVKPHDSTRLLIGIRNHGGADATNIKSFLTTEGSSNILIYDYVDTNTTILPAGEVSTLEYGFFNTETVGSEIFFLQEMIGDYFSRVNSFSLQVIDSLENFDTGDFTYYPWDLTEGDSEWVIDSINTAYDGRFSAKSGIILAQQSSELKLKINILKDGLISFYKKTSEYSVSCRALTFMIDSIVQQQWPGSIGWSKEVFPVTAGIHTFTWKYHKQFSTLNDSLDGVWIDYITFPDFELVPGGVTETDISDELISIFPNPNDGNFNVLFRNGINNKTTIDILNMNGQLVFRQQLTALAKNSILNINSTNFSKGIYIVKLQNANKIITGKVIVR